MIKKQPKKYYDVVVVGGGHNALVAAAYLARANLSVLVLERNEVLGGAAQSAKMFPGFDANISRYSYLLSLFPEKIAADLQLDFSTKRRRYASYTAHSSGGKEAGLLLSNTDTAANQRAIESMVGGRKNWHGYQHLAALQKDFAGLVWPSLLEPLRSIDSFKSELVSASLAEAWHSFVERPLGEIIERSVIDDALRGLILTDAKIGVDTSAHDQSLLQNRTFIYHIIGGGTGDWQVPVGGMGALVSELIESCKRAGVDFQAGAQVTSIESDGSLASVQCEGSNGARSYECEYVLCNAANRVLQGLRGSSDPLSGSDQGSVFKVNVLLQKLPTLRSGINASDAFTGSFHVAESYSQMEDAYQATQRNQLPDVLPFEMYCHSLTDSSILSAELRDSGFQTLTLFGLDLPYRLFLEDNEALKAKVLQYYLTALDDLCVDSFEGCIARQADGRLCVEAHSPLDLERELSLPGGNIFHDAPSWFFAESESEIGRWGVETDLANVVLASSSAKRGGAVSGVPGRNAAMYVLERKGIKYP